MLFWIKDLATFGEILNFQMTSIHYFGQLKRPGSVAAVDFFVV